MHRHEPDPLDSFLKDCRFIRNRSFSFLLQLLDKTSERNASADLKASRHVTNSLQICQNLVARRPKSKSSMGPGQLQDLMNCLHHRTVVTVPMEIGQYLKRTANHF